MTPSKVSYDAIVLSGGQGRRLGGVSKGELSVAGKPLLSYGLRATTGARRTIVVGPVSTLHPAELTTREDPPGGGPVAGIAAGFARLEATGSTHSWMLVLACDVPRAGELVEAMEKRALSAAPDVSGVWVVDGDGREQPLLAMYRSVALRDALTGIGTVHCAAVRTLTASMTMVAVQDKTGATRDADTWGDVESLRETLS